MESGLTSDVDVPLDQYEDARICKLWGYYLRDKTSQRTEETKDFILRTLKDHGSKQVLDVACGAGADSIPLVEAGFDVVSIDGSDRFLKYALETRWQRRKEPSFDKWVIGEGNWLTLHQDLIRVTGDAGVIQRGFDAVVCAGNSLAFLPDKTGDLTDQRKILKDFVHLLRPGGLLLIDHRNYDYILDHGKIPNTGVSHSDQQISSIEVELERMEGKDPTRALLHYTVNVPYLKRTISDFDIGDLRRFSFSYYPYRLEHFKALLHEAFDSSLGEHNAYGNFKPLGEVATPDFYTHVVKKVA